MDYTRASGLYGAGFPSDDLVVEGQVDLSLFPNPEGNGLVDQLLALGDGVDGFGTTSTVYFTTSGPIQEASLPDLLTSTSLSATVFLVSVDPQAPDFRKRYPVQVRFEQDGGPYGAANLLAVLPFQGVPLRPSTRYAVAVTTDLRDADDYMFARSDTLSQIDRGLVPPGMDDGMAAALDEALDVIEESGTPREDVAALTVFTTWDPTAGIEPVLADARTHTPIPPASFELTETFDTYCVYESAVTMPVYQSGEPPFMTEGGAFAFDGDAPVLQAEEQARVVVTVPRVSMPTSGWPTAVMVRTGGGGDRPLVDRGPTAEPGGEPLYDGGGPALHFAAAGYAGMSVDGPHGGLRNVSGSDEQFLIFNVANPEAMRDNLRQSAIELALLPDFIDGLSLDTSACPGAPGTSTFDTTDLAMMGHSMGATIAPLVLAIEPRYRALILSGGGASWIENVVHKQSPLEVRPLAEAMLGFTDRELTEHDPALALLQWFGEPADPQVYARRLVLEPPSTGSGSHVLMLQGIVDTYIMPSIANALSASLGLDQGGQVLDDEHRDLLDFLPAPDAISYNGGELVELPVFANKDGLTAVLVQHLEDGIQDGHEIVFQADAPKHQYRCFLQTLSTGEPLVPDFAKAADQPCE